MTPEEKQVINEVAEWLASFKEPPMSEPWIDDLVSEAHSQAKKLRRLLTANLRALLESIAFPKHIALSIEHNKNKVYYQTVENYVADLESHDSGPDWASPDEKGKAITTNEIWQMRWYPITPVGSYDVAAASLEELLEFVRLKTNGSSI